MSITRQAARTLPGSSAAASVRAGEPHRASSGVMAVILSVHHHTAGCAA